MSQLPTTQEDEAQTPSNEQCGATAVSDFVEELQDLPDIPVNTPSEIEQLAQLYDESQTLPNKNNHAPFFPQAHPEFVPYMKAFMFKAWDNLQASIQINSVYRTPRDQQRLIAAYNADPANKAKPGTTSYHLWGMAMDFNPTLRDGTTLGKAYNSSEQSWRASGIVTAGESVNLYWGGNFSRNYDPIHFDFRNVAPSTRQLAALTEEQNLTPAPNRVVIA
jgi:hypothetical protein